MDFLSLEQDAGLVWMDFGFYGLVVAGLVALVLYTVPSGQAWQALAWAGAGIVGWTLVEYGLHRFVLHGLEPFKRWHGLHHAHPHALIATPTVLTAGLFALLAGLPAWWLLPVWMAGTLVLGILVGYLIYIVTHHAVHHAASRSGWLHRRKLWHALHHRQGARGCYGVSTPAWDHVFRSARTGS